MLGKPPDHGNIQESNTNANPASLAPIDTHIHSQEQQNANSRRRYGIEKEPPSINNKKKMKTDITLRVSPFGGSLGEEINRTWKDVTLSTL